MFICAKCQKVSAPGEKMTKTPSETRRRLYIYPDGKKTKGTEIVREIGLCKACAGREGK